ncbi:hypothetical protein CONLIGDRAFT_404601 [Coniochaeta ligniaria NRRL 30616]|uniref:Uncharacterized protein n=1 Tax=Coniochaeta ligniaria NRRL 30616 TaxID=1408157 RepID=A0A1J7J6X2_9PEZI|nr:hypothetical protein CONLIGDRAFT_404601 [Coniochaeta ligniaria NRRL 30616]
MYNDQTCSLTTAALLSLGMSRSQDHGGQNLKAVHLFAKTGVGNWEGLGKKGSKKHAWSARGVDQVVLPDGTSNPKNYEYHGQSPLEIKGSLSCSLDYSH